MSVKPIPNEDELRPGFAFEREVRRVAEAVWRLEPGAVQPKTYGGIRGLHEVDGVVELRDVTHVLMATLETKLDKIEADVEKLLLAEKQEGRRGVPVRKWLITEKELNGQHITLARGKGVEVLTLANFRARYFDGGDYLRLRRGQAFGSARDPGTDSITIADSEYIEPELTAEDSQPGRRTPSERPITFDALVEMIEAGRYVIVIGQFGVGKSLTTRQVFMHLAGAYYRRARQSELVPLAINLREQWGMRTGKEILERHGANIGFRGSDDLPGAWRSGMVHLLLDGFDELASQTIARVSDRNFLRAARFEALAGVRDLVNNLPSGSGLLLCGRDHYFDDLSELIDGLGLNGKSFSLVRLGSFTEEQVARYLTRHTGVSEIPAWIPRKPLLLGYLATHGLIDGVMEIDGSRGFGFAWTNFLDLICYREAEHERSTMDPTTIRRVLWRLAAAVRSTVSGVGPLTGPDLAEAYRSETGDQPGEGVLMQLQRLPGLTPRDQDPTGRSFVDDDFLAALQGELVANAIMTNSTEIAERRWLTGLSVNGIEMAAYKLAEAGHTSATVLDAAIRWSSAARDRPWETQLATDALLVALELADGAPLDAQGVEVRGSEIFELDLDDHPIDNVVISNSTIAHLTIGNPDQTANLRFKNCFVARVSGAYGKGALPTGLFDDESEIAEYDDASTNAAVIRLDLPPGIRVLMTMLRKLFVQSGRGRKVSALRRGLPEELVAYVQPCLSELQSAGIAQVYGQVVQPVMKHEARVRKMLAAGLLSDDVVVKRVLARQA